MISQNSEKLNLITEEISYMGYENVTFFSDYDYTNAILGISIDGQLIYDYEKMIECIQESEKISREQAIDWIEYNVIGNIPQMGELHPIIMEHFMCEESAEN